MRACMSAQVYIRSVSVSPLSLPLPLRPSVPSPLRTFLPRSLARAHTYESARAHTHSHTHVHKLTFLLSSAAGGVPEDGLTSNKLCC